jgi:hypothetical protein
MATYKALVGLDYAGKRIEAGQTVDDIPAKSVAWLVEQGLISQVSAPSKTEKPVVKREPESPEKEA